MPRWHPLIRRGICHTSPQETATLLDVREPLIACREFPRARILRLGQSRRIFWRSVAEPEPSLGAQLERLPWILGSFRPPQEESWLVDVRPWAEPQNRPWLRR